MANLGELSQQSVAFSNISLHQKPQARHSEAAATEPTYHSLGARLALAASVCVLVTSILVLTGWQFGIEGLMTVLLGYIRMKPNTAIALAFAALALLAEYFDGSRRLRISLAVATLAIGAATAFEYVSDISLGIDQFLFIDPIQETYPGRMAPVTVANLIVIGLALLARTSRRFRRAGSLLALLAGLSSMFTIVGYAYGVTMYGSIKYTTMALNTAISVLLLALATLALDPTEPLGKLFRSNGSGGLVARRLVPLAVAAPLVLGFVFVKPRFTFNHVGLAVALTVVGCVALLFGMIVSLAQALERRDAEIDVARRDSLVDGLTGACNRRQFDLQIEKEIARSLRDDTPFSLIVMDVDHFKKLNDAFGHLSGDSVLRIIAEAGTKAVRASDFFCRYGGEEFAVIAPGADEAVAIGLAERLRRTFAKLVFDGIDRGVTISAGVTQFARSDESGADLVSRADLALYRAKDAGRDCVRYARPTGDRSLHILPEKSLSRHPNQAAPKPTHQSDRAR